MAKIPADCKNYILNKFIDDCFIKHCLAFFQWRQKYRTDEHLKDVLEGTAECVKNRILSELDISKAVSEKTV